MIAMRHFLIPPLVAAALLAVGCEEIVTGEHVQSIEVAENDDGSYGPVNLTLTPDMAPVAINFRAEHGIDVTEVDKWNSYRATLTRNGTPVASGQFHVNYSGTADSPQGAPYLIMNMLTVQPRDAGDHELTVTPTKPVEVRLSHTQIEGRRNVQDSRPPR